MARGALQTLVNPVFAQAFILTFLGEWGDRYVPLFSILA
jgi:putative Ca2+/H+ antiporter (TMEM165/GDT1 family)